MILNYLFKCIDENELLNLISQDLIPIWFWCKTTSIYKPWNFINLDCDPPKDICAVFLDISKVFGKISLSGLIFKSKSFRISDNLLEFINSFLSNRFQSGFINGVTSEWEKKQCWSATGLNCRAAIFPNSHKWSVWSRILESLAGCRTMSLFAVFCKIGALECKVYWFHV